MIVDTWNVSPNDNNRTLCIVICTLYNIQNIFDLFIVILKVFSINIWAFFIFYQAA